MSPYPEHTAPSFWRQKLDAVTRTTFVGNSQSTRIHPRRVYILPTRFGLIYSVALFAMLVGANNYGSNPGFLFTFLLAGLGLAALMQTWRNLVGLHIRSVEAPPVFCGSQAAFTLKLENSYPSVRPAIGARFHRHKDARRGTVDLPSRQARNVIASITAHRRGRLRPGRIVLETSYPLGMFRAWTFVDTATSCLVYPRPADITGGLDADADSQGARNDRQSGNEDFAGHRPYQQGDNVMHIDWKAAARGKGWNTKVFDTERGNRVWLKWDAIEHADDERKLSLLTRAVLELDAENREFGLILPGVRIEPAAGEAHVTECLTALALHGDV